MHLCGVRGSAPAPGIEFIQYGGHTSCLALIDDRAPKASSSPHLILDAGDGLQMAAKLLNGGPFSGTILLSHLHWDHTLGLPFFAAADRVDAHVRVLLPEQENGDDAASVLSGMMRPPYFPVGPTGLRGEWQFGTVAPGEWEVEGFTVLAREIPHKGGRTMGYRVSDGRSTLTYMPDHNPTALGPGEDGFGEYHPAAIELAQDADVLVHDAQLFPPELAAEGDFGHAVADYAVELGKRADCRAVVLFHHRHTRTDEALDGLARRFRDTSPKVSVATEGSVLRI
ncbi:MAG TPA: MBL fold metallo-hydrolase [Solirubrobacteraceae bacterium]|nr:MBL fold metallo-hydrolase [Solirubrobacteraceae bacterium]